MRKIGQKNRQTTESKMESAYAFDVDQTIKRYADLVYRIAMVQMKNKVDAEDIFQEVFLRLVKYRHTIESEEHLKAWLIRVTINCSRKELAKVSHKREVSIEQGGYTVEPGVCDHYSLGESESEIGAAVSHLTESYRTVIYLFYYEEYSIKEISQMLNITEILVKTRLSRARKILKKTIREVI